MDLIDNQFNRCPICGENILYCDVVIDFYASNELENKINDQNKEIGRGRKRIKSYSCLNCENFKNGKCIFSNYYGIVKGKDFIDRSLSKKSRHYHTKCVVQRIKQSNKKKNFLNDNLSNFFAQIPKIIGLENL